MSESQGHEAVTLEGEGVAVTKRYEQDDFPVPAIAFEFSAGREEAVTVTLRDEVPADIEVEDLGFHPEYGSEFWDADSEQITFQREFSPGEAYTTVYGIRATGTDNIDQFLTTPTLEVDPPLPDGAEAPADVEAAVAVEAPEVESEAPTASEDGADVDTLELNDPNEAGSAETATPEDGAEEDGDGPAVTVPEDSLVAAMAEELRDNAVSKEDVTLLRRAFDLAAEDEGSVRARVDKLQRDVSEVVAYTEALEEFLDENGTAADIGEFQDRFADVEADLDSLSSRLDDQAGDVEAVEETVADLESTVADLESTVDGVEGTVAELESDLAEVREQTAGGDLESEIDAIEADIEELQAWREQLSSVIGGE